MLRHYLARSPASANSREVPRGDVVVAWLCERAPLWVIGRVCALLRFAFPDDESSDEDW
jgi:hypothetical protein